jgi:hypothetical protein
MYRNSLKKQDGLMPLFPAEALLRFFSNLISVAKFLSDNISTSQWQILSPAMVQNQFARRNFR